MKIDIVKEYYVKCAVPASTNRWKADIVTRNITAENLNQVIMHVLTYDEYRKGARILEVWERNNEDYTYTKIA